MPKLTAKEREEVRIDEIAAAADALKKTIDKIDSAMEDAAQALSGGDIWRGDGHGGKGRKAWIARIADALDDAQAQLAELEREL